MTLHSRVKRPVA